MDPEQNDYNNYSEEELLLSVGRLLREQRESMGIHLDTASQELFIDRHNLEALENDDFQKIGSFVFARGYTRNYARFLGLDVDRIVAILEPHLKKMDKRENRSVQFLDVDKRTRAELDYSKAHFDFKDRKKPVFWLYFIIVVVLIAMAAFVGFRYLSEAGSGSTKTLELQAEALQPIEPKPQQNPTPVPQVDENSQIQDLPGRLLEQQTVLEEQNEPLQNQAKETNQDITSEGANADLTTSSGFQRLDFAFSSNSWLHIVDANDNEITSQIYRNGDNPSFFVEAPANIIIGNSGQVTMQANGAVFDFSSFVRGDVARFSLEK